MTFSGYPKSRVSRIAVADRLYPARGLRLGHLRVRDLVGAAQNAAAAPPGRADRGSAAAFRHDFYPAKDEGERIRGCIQSVLDQDYTDVRIVAIDDRSSDRTGAIMDEMAQADPRLNVLHITQPPAPGWTGKNNALYTAAKDAPGDWLLFVDSDVVLEKMRCRRPWRS